MKLHLRGEGDLAACGSSVPNDWTTTVKADVTCLSCSRDWTPSEKRAWANKKARESEGYANPDFAGFGILKCHVCGNKIRDHKRWPCNLRVDGQAIRSGGGPGVAQ